MIKKLIILFGMVFAIFISIGNISANTTTVKVEVVSRNIENHTINVKTDDSNADKFTLKKISATQMDIANKGSIIKVTYDDKFNIITLDKLNSGYNDTDSIIVYSALMGIFIFALWMFT